MKFSRRNAKRNARLFTLGALAAPFATVQGARLFMAAPGPSAAPGATITSAVPPPGGLSDFGPAVAPAKPTPAQQKAIEWLDAHRLQPPGAAPVEGDLSPMDRAAVKAAPPPPVKPPDPPPQPVIPMTPAADALKGLHVTAVMGTEAQAGGAIAVIGGKLRRAGDEVAPDWTIASINARDWVVHLTHTTGESATLCGIRPSQQNR